MQVLVLSGRFPEQKAGPREKLILCFKKLSNCASVYRPSSRHRAPFLHIVTNAWCYPFDCSCPSRGEMVCLHGVTCPSLMADDLMHLFFVLTPRQGFDSVPGLGRLFL